MKESITSNPDISRESLEKSLPELKKLLLNSYQEQGNASYTLDQAFEKTNKLYQEISSILKGRGIMVESNKGAIMSLFQKNKIVFSISPMAVGPGQYRVNHPMFLLGKGEPYDMSRIRFDTSYGLPIIKKGVSTSEVKEILVPDIRESQGFMLDGLTVTNSQTGENTVLLFPDRLIKNAEKYGLGIRDYRDIVATNEVSQVYFSRLIHPQLYKFRLAEDLKMSAPPNTTIFQAQEAFSDLCSFKFTKGGKEEMIGILQSSNDGYTFSKFILSENLRLQFPMMRTNAIPDKLRGMNPEDFQGLKLRIIAGYEKTLLPMMKLISDGIKESGKK